MSMSMTRKHRRALDRTLQVLSDDLDLQPAITHLRSKELFTEDHESRINAQQGQTKMVSEFVTILKRSGDEAYSTFRTYLLDCQGQRHIATELDQSLEEVEECCVLVGVQILNVISCLCKDRQHTSRHRQP